LLNSSIEHRLAGTGSKGKTGANKWFEQSHPNEVVKIKTNAG
jgi:hypothetical protein